MCKLQVSLSSGVADTAGATDASVAALLIRGGLVLHPYKYLRCDAPHDVHLNFPPYDVNIKAEHKKKTARKRERRKLPEIGSSTFHQCNFIQPCWHSCSGVAMHCCLCASIYALFVSGLKDHHPILHTTLLYLCSTLPGCPAADYHKFSS